MDYLELIKEIFDICIIPLLAVLTKYVVAFISKKSKEVQNQIDNDMANKYIDMLTNTVMDCVIATNQTYVNALKKEGKFDTEAQKAAFKLTEDAVMTILTEDAKSYLNNLYGDLGLYINKLIEVQVNVNKGEI